MPVNTDYFLPSAKIALDRVANAQATGVIHTDAWVRELSAYAPEAASEVDWVLGETLHIRSYSQSEFHGAPLLYLPSSNKYAKRLSEFAGAARYIAEALQRAVHLVDPECSVSVLTAQVPLIAPNTGVALLIEGKPAMLKALQVMETDASSQFKAIVCIHPDLEETPATVPTYRVDRDPNASSWAGIPPTPLAITRWIPEICTYLDTIRPWLDLRVI